MTAQVAVLHVIPGPRGRWLVTEDAGSQGALSEHADASTALLAASRETTARGGGDVLVHDRYHRIHPHHCAASR
jgi:hypothetical protein